nr:zinc finger, CCHC-type, retrotransposon Gag domain protein [Tanacetum cinerariifolium]
MVTTRNNLNDNVPNFEAMINATVANALPNLTIALRNQITNDIRNGVGPSGGGGGDDIPHGIHVWIEMFTKLKPLSFRSAATPAEAEDWITHMEKYFPASEQQCYEGEYGSICQLDRENSREYMKRFTRLASFVGAAAGDAQRQARHFKWGLKKWVLDRIINMDYTNVAQVLQVRGGLLRLYLLHLFVLPVESFARVFAIRLLGDVLLVALLNIR